MVKSFTAVLIFAIILSLSSFGQEKDKINKGKSDLVKLREEISSLEKELKIKTSKEKESFKTLENYNKQSFLLNKLLAQLREEEQLKDNEINYNELRLQEIEQEMKSLRQNYAKYAKTLYMHGIPDELEIVMSSGTLEKAILRQKYFEKFSDKRKSDLTKLNESKQEYLALKDQLELEKSEKVKLKDQKQQEENSLSMKLKERKKLLTVIRKDKEELKKEIDAKKTAEVKIRAMISKLIEDAERKRKEQEKLALLEKERLKKNTKNKTTVKETKREIVSSDYDVDLSTSGLSSFSVLKGRLNWPVSGGRIIKQFGENRNSKLNTVTINYGVDIKAGSDLNVKSVADGVVSAIDWIPGYGSVLIITHKGDYRTVYSHLSEIFVKEGNKVKAGSVLAKVGESIDGNIIHFEIWNSRNNQNPEVWLARK